MNMVFIGEYIQKRRKSMGLTQEAVCRGICDCATLSRIENGRVTPRKTASAPCSSGWACRKKTTTPSSAKTNWRSKR